MDADNYERYLALERAMLSYDADGSKGAAEAVRAVMDDVWLRLSDEERQLLDSRDMEGDE